MAALRRPGFPSTHGAPPVRALADRARPERIVIEYEATMRKNERDDPQRSPLNDAAPRQDGIQRAWCRFWMKCAVVKPLRPVAVRLAEWATPPYKGRQMLAWFTRRGYISPRATIHHDRLRCGAHVFIGDNVVIYCLDDEGGSVELGDRVHLHQDTIIETGQGGSVTIGAETHIQPRCQLSAYLAPITIGRQVQIAPYCAFYPYDHAIAPGERIYAQPLQTKGGIVIEDDVWMGVGAIVLDGVRIGQGAVIAAGAVVRTSVPAGAIAAGVPARIIGRRGGAPATAGNTGAVSADNKADKENANSMTKIHAP